MLIESRCRARKPLGPLRSVRALVPNLNLPVTVSSDCFHLENPPRPDHFPNVMKTHGYLSLILTLAALSPAFAADLITRDGQTCPEIRKMIGFIMV